MARRQSLVVLILTALWVTFAPTEAAESLPFAPDTLTLLAVSPHPGTAAVSSDTRKITLMFDRAVVPVTLLGQAHVVAFPPPPTPTPLLPPITPTLAAPLTPDAIQSVVMPSPTPLTLGGSPGISLPNITIPGPPPIPPLISITPAVEGVGMWVHPAVYEFTLAEKALQGGMTYHVVLDPALQAVDGTRLDQPFVWSFTVVEPQVLHINATRSSDDGVWRESGFTIAFSQPMDRPTTEAAFKLYKNRGGACSDGCSNHPRYWEPVEGSFTWDTASTRMTFWPAQLLEYSRSAYSPQYRATLGPNARNALGTPVMTSAHTYLHPVFTPAVIATTPIQGGTTRPGRQRVTFRFQGIMDTESYRGRYTVTPAPPGGITPYVNEDGSLSLEFDAEQEGAYTVTIQPGIKDVYGTAMQDAYTFTYSVREPSPEATFRLSMPSNQYLAIANPAADRPSVMLHATNSPIVDVSIYRADFDMLLRVNEQYGKTSGIPYGLFQELYADKSIWRANVEYAQSVRLYLPWRQPEYLVSRMRHTLTTTTTDPAGEAVSVPLWTEDDAPLPLGLYGVDMSGKTGFVLAVANVGLTLKRSHNELLVWVTDHASGQPLPNLPVRVQGLNSVTVGRSDSTGLARFPVTGSSGLLFVTAQDDTHFGLWYSDYGSSVAGTSPYLYTDRSIYRPGDPVHYRGILRDRDDVTYTVPADLDTVFVRVRDYCYDTVCSTPATIYEAQRPLTTFGTFSDSFALPADLAPNHYALEMSTCPFDESGCTPRYAHTVYFQVAEYRVPDYTVELTPQRDEIMAGQPVNVEVFAAYYSGSGMGVGQVSVRSHGYGTGFVYTGSETGFVFGDGGGWAEIYPLPPAQPLNKTGHTLLTTVPNIQSNTPVRMVLEATVIDGSGQAISGQTALTIHPSNVYMGVRANAQNAAAVPIDVLSIFADSTTRPHQSFTMEIIEQRPVRQEGLSGFGSYFWSIREILVTSVSSQTDAQGRYRHMFKPPQSGTYRIVIKTQDEQGRAAQTGSTFTITDSTDSLPPAARETLNRAGSCQWGEPVVRLNLVADQTLYTPGDTALITLPNPYGVPVQALITLERQGISRQEVMTLGAQGDLYRLPLTGDDAPNVIVSVVLIRPTSLVSLLPVFLRGSVSLNVDNVERRLVVEVMPSTTEAAPGEVVTFDLRVTDHRGEPVSAEVGVALVDEAVQNLYYNYRPSFESHYYAAQSSNVTTVSSGIALLQDVSVDLASTCGQGGGGGGGLRRDFETTPLWAPHVVTDASGQASVSLTMPTNLTRWTFSAIAITPQTQVGEAEATLTTNLPLTVRAAAPRFLTVGDHLPLSAVIQNNTDQTRRVTITLTTRGFTLRDDNAVQNVSLAPHTSQRVDWWGTVQESDGVFMAVSARADNGLADAAIPTLTTGEGDTIPVYSFETVDTVMFSGQLDSASRRTESLDLRLDPLPDTAHLALEFTPTLAGGLLTQALNVASYPLPDEASLLEAASQLRWNMAVLGLEAGLRETQRDTRQAETAALIARLAAAQNADGGWGWYEDAASDSFVTTEIVIGLAQANALEFSVNGSVLASATAYLHSLLMPPLVNTPPAEMEHQVQLLYALSLVQQADETWLDHLFEMRSELPIAARAQLLLAYLNTAPTAAPIDALVSDLTDAARITATNVSWHEAETTVFDDTRPTALALLALLKASPRHPLATNAVRWLAAAHEDASQRSREQTLWMIAALSEWLRQTGETAPAYRFSATLNDEPVMEGAFTADTQDALTWSGDDTALQTNQDNSLVIQRSAGAGLLNYSGVLRLTYAADAVGTVQRGIRLEREYLRDADLQPLTSAVVGEVVVVRLTLYVAQDVSYLTLQDTLPSGLEPIDPLLLTTTQYAETPHLRSIDRSNAYWYWGYWYWSRTQIRDTGIRLSALSLPRGVYTYTYQARAMTPGDFLVPPAQAFAARQPEIEGRTAASRFVIVP